MKKFIFIVFSFISLSLSSQIPVGNWRTHLAYSSVKQVAETPEKVYGLSDGALFSYDKTDQSVDTYSKLTGLSDTKISRISYSPQNKVLLVVYDNSNIDVLNDAGDIINIPDIKNKTTTLDKSVYAVNFFGSKAYVATGYGISIINLLKYEVTDSYVNKKTYSAVVFNGNLYTATVDGVYQGSLSSNLNDFNNWTLVADLRATSLLVFQNQLVALNVGSGLFTLANKSYQPIYSTNTLIGMTLAGNSLLAYGPNEVSVFNSVTSKTTYSNITGINGLSTIDADQSVWIASGSSLNRFDRINGVFKDAELRLKPDGPIANSPYLMRFASDNKLLVVGGGAWDDRFNTPGHLMKFENEKWSHTRVDTINIDGGARDFVDVIEDPNEKNHLYVASWGEGLYEFSAGKLVKIHNYTNSGLEYISFAGPHYHRINALCYDADGNLFMSNNEISNVIKVLTKEGVWINLNYSAISGKTSVHKMIRDKRGFFWALNVRAGSGVFIFDPKKTLSNMNDDQSIFYKQFNYYDNAELKTIAPENYYCLAEDKNGAIWIGTSEGPIVFNSPSKVFNDDFTCSRIKVPRNDGTDLADYLLDGVKIRAIAVDGGNRKWLGTENNGVYLVSDNGLETIHHFTAENSPLLSDKILSIAIHPTTGEVFIGTDKGLVSYRSDAIDGKKTYSDVYAFPNPVRPEYEGVITITGLKYKSTVRITDISGNSLFEGISEGGQITWNGRNRSGERVATGVYLVYAATSDGLDGIVTKILVVK